MDKTLLKLEIGKWNEACRFLKSKQTELSTAEWTAIETLADYWRKKFDPDATSECMDLISTLEQSDKLHSNNKEIIVWSKEFRTIARKYYTKDETTFLVFQNALKGLYQSSAPRSSAPLQTPVNSESQNIILKQNAKKWVSTYSQLYENQNELDRDEWNAVRFLANFWKNGTFNETSRKECEQYISILIASDKLHSNNKNIITWSKDFRGIAKTYYTKDSKTFEDFKKFMTKYTRENPIQERTPQERIPQTPPRQTSPSIEITGLVIANTDEKGDPIPSNQAELDTRSCYLQPRIDYRVLRGGSSVDIWYKLYAPDRTLMTASNSKSGYTWYGNVPLTGSRSAYPLNGFGSMSGNVFSAGQWIIEFFENDLQIATYTFTIKQHRTSTPPPQSRVTPPPPPRTPSNRRTSTVSPKKGHGGLWSFLIIAAIIGFCGYQYWYKPMTIDRDAERTYVYVSSLLQRSDKNANVEYNRIQSLPYGSELITYQKEGDGWSYIKANEKKGYVSTNYTLSKADFELLNNLWGSKEAMEGAPTAKCRLALVDFIKKNNYKTGTGQWQLFAQPIEVKPNAVLYPRLANGYTKFTEFAFVLSNSSTHEGVLAIYSFADDETPVFIYQEQTTENAQIKDIKYYPWKTDKYKVIYATPNATVSRSPQLPTNQQPSKTKSENGLKITKALFGNTDKSYNVLTQFGTQLPTTTQYLSPRIFYENPAGKSSVVIKYKIITPQGNLMTGTGSPSGYTNEQKVTLNRSGYINLAGWGNTTGDAYTSGTYRIEFWSEGQLLYSTGVQIQGNSEKAVTVSSKPVECPIKIRTMLFANSNDKGTILEDYGKPLYGNKLQYLKPKIIYSSLNGARNITLYAKIYRPNGVLIANKNSPNGYTYKHGIYTPAVGADNNVSYLTSWGSPECDVYSPGTYQYEIWYEGSKIFSCQVIVH